MFIIDFTEHLIQSNSNIYSVSCFLIPIIKAD